MKTFVGITLFILLPFLSMAQSSLTPSQAVQRVMKDVRMGMSLKDFKRAHPKAKLDVTATIDTRIEYLENAGNGIKEITYYFLKTDDSPFFEAIVELESENEQKRVTQNLFGTFNHPIKQDHWVIYNGQNDFLTVAWVYETKMIFTGNVAGNPYENDDMFKVSSDFPQIDMRLCKNSISDTPKKQGARPDESKQGSSGKKTILDYNKAMNGYMASRVRLELAADSISIFLPTVIKKPQTVNYRQEYIYKVQENGLKEVSIMTNKGDKKVVYELIFEFEDADTTLLWAEQGLGGFPKHPSLDNHWVMFIDEKTSDNYRFMEMAWVYENKLILAGNVLKSEFENEDDFKLTDEYVEEWKKTMNGERKKGPYNNPERDARLVEQINAYLESAANNFEDMMGENLGTNKFESKIKYEDSEKTIIRKNSVGKCRLEATFPSGDIDNANFVYDLHYYDINLEALAYRLVLKTEVGKSSEAGRTQVWDVQTLDDVSTGIIIKLQTYKTGTGSFAVKLEIGK